MAKQKKKKTFLDKLQNKYRLVVLNDDTFEERASFRLSRFNVYVLFTVQIFILTVILISVIIFTPLKEYVPGYGDVDMRKELFFMKSKADSLEIMVNQQDKWLKNLQNILTGNVDTSSNIFNTEGLLYDSLDITSIPLADEQLRDEIENEQNYSLIFSDKTNSNKTFSNIKMFPPVKGFITQKFNSNTNHFGVDIVAPENEPIKATLAGTVVVADWSLETGYVIGVQHDYGLISLYKHNSVLLKKVGNFVEAGDAIAVIGNTGELSDGPHLHFELWHKQIPVDPVDYIIF